MAFGGFVPELPPFSWRLGARGIGQGRVGSRAPGRHFRFGPHGSAVSGRQIAYRIASSARDNSDGGIVRPSAFAVLRLMTSSNDVGC